jgi:hypothetical protein
MPSVSCLLFGGVVVDGSRGGIASLPFFLFSLFINIFFFFLLLLCFITGIRWSFYVPLLLSRSCLGPATK